MWYASGGRLYEAPGTEGGCTLPPGCHPQEVGLPCLQVTQQEGVVRTFILAGEDSTVRVCGACVTDLKAELKAFIWYILIHLERKDG